MNRLETAFSRALADHRAALMPYLTVGFPDLDTLADLVTSVAGAGADIIELGFPFSDPIADGQVIQDASTKALSAGFVQNRAFSQIAAASARTPDTALVLMSYYNPILRTGLESFVGRARNAGIDALLVPDLPVEESGDLAKVCAEYKVDLVQMVSPNITDERLALVASAARGFIYAVAVEGTTGARGEISVSLVDYVERIRARTDLPVAVGFGISSRDQARQVAKVADGVIVGSALIRVIGETTEPAHAAATFVANLDTRKLPVNA
jgi:tryptophan synthase alpha chain